jgi:preprotein translocase subunit SecG
MSVFVVVIHVIVCFALIMIVLLQTGKGADMGAAFGGGASNTLFGTTGASSFLSKATTAAAVVFMLTSLTLAYMSGYRADGRLVTDPPPPPAQTMPAPESVPIAPYDGRDREAAEQLQRQQEQEQPAPEQNAPAAPQGEQSPGGQGQTNQ